jgi:1,4-dihydroxy-2-naphthoate octaprenyltransferase
MGAGAGVYVAGGTLTLTDVTFTDNTAGFNGGSGMLPAGLLKPEQVWRYGLICFLIAVPIGVFFSIAQGWQLLPLLLIGGFCILFYTPIILKIHIPEWSPGVGLGVLPVLGAYFVQTGNYTLTAFIASIPSGLLVTNLLLLNEFPDAEADKIGDKKTLPITIGKKNAAIVYSVLTILVYVWIVGAVIAGQMPLFCLIALLTLPLAVKAIQGSFGYGDGQILLAMANNVLTVLYQALLVWIY